MDEFIVTFARSARKELEALDNSVIVRIFTKIEMLTEEPRPAGCKKLVGQNDLWRIRVGDYRMIYTIDDEGKVVDVVAVRHRRETYQ